VWYHPGCFYPGYLGVSSEATVRSRLSRRLHPNMPPDALDGLSTPYPYPPDRTLLFLLEYPPRWVPWSDSIVLQLIWATHWASVGILNYVRSKPSPLLHRKHFFAAFLCLCFRDTPRIISCLQVAMDWYFTAVCATLEYQFQVTYLEYESSSPCQTRQIKVLSIRHVTSSIKIRNNVLIY
jgi:hypothetical protein